MIKFLKHKLAEASLLRSQRRVAEELHSIYETRAALESREAYLFRLAGQLAVREIDQNITARRVAKAAA